LPNFTDYLPIITDFYNLAKSTFVSSFCCNNAYFLESYFVNQKKLKMKFILKMTSLIALLFLVSCQHDALGGGSILGGDNCAYSIKYDAEVMMTQTPVNAADLNGLTPQDRVGLMPHTTRSAVDFCMKDNGSSEWVVEKMQPRQVFEAKSHTLPDPSPKTKTIRIANDKATFLDANGKVIKTTDFQVNTLTVGLNNLMNLAKNGSGSGNFDKMLADARKDNAEIIDMGEGVFTIRKTLPNSSDVMSIMVDKNMSRVLSNAVSNQFGKPKYVVVYAYEAGATPILKHVIQRSFSKSPSGVEMKSEKTIEFLKLEISGKFPTKNDQNDGQY
jgi:hypothetical protein